MDRMAARTLWGYAVIALGGLVGARLAPEPWSALFFIVGVFVGAVALLTLVWSRVDVEGIRHLFRRDE